MRHVRPISKAATTTGDFVNMVLALLQALAPIITWLIESKPSQTS